MVDAFSLKLQRNNRQNAFGYGFHQGETLRKSLYFHYVVEAKQPYTMTEPRNKASTASYDAAKAL